MKKLLLVVCLLLLAGCAGHNLRENATSFAASRGFVPVLFDTGKFTVFALFKKGTFPVLHTYIEGDGHAWINRTTPSKDPTPHNPVALYLATNDPAPASVLYLARPCQYFMNAQCHRQYWTNARMSEAVIASLNEAITQAKELAAATKVCLVGFSGGGGCAPLIATRRNDVIFLGSVAGNLNVGAWTSRHNLSPLDKSLEPLQAAPLLHGIPQRHYAGKDDNVIPPELSQSFCKATGQIDACTTIPAITHGGAWQKVWDYSYY